MANEIRLELVSRSVFQISSRRYRQLANEGIVPQPINGKIDFVAATRDVISYYRKLAEGQGSLTLTDQRTELVGIKKERERLKLEIERGNYVPRDQQYQWLGMILTELKGSLLALPRRLAPILFSKSNLKEVEIELDESLKSILRESAKPLGKQNAKTETSS